MSIPDNNIDRLFAAIGLPIKIERGNHTAAARLAGTDFICYIRKGYPDSTEHSSDEVHRMFETIRIHRPTGIRFSCLSHESYDGQSVEYTLFNAHIITSTGRELAAIGVDMDKRVVITPGEVVAFSNISREQE